MTSSMERLDKLLARQGLGSRSQVKAWILDGRVTVDGEPCRDSGAKGDPAAHRVALDEKELDLPAFHYGMLNKPPGVLTAASDRRAKTVADLLPPSCKAMGMMPVGRLDKDTEGLLLITNDGQLAHLLLSPRKGVDKTYYAKIDGVVLPEHVECFKKGVQLEDGYLTLPAELEIERSDLISIVQVTIQEGKYHQVKRMFAAHGLRVVYLKRIRMGSLMLDNQLDEGEYRELTDEEIEVLKKEVGMV